ncbi:MAG: LysM peptidoglycan-binding domain-containing protein [Ignavibacteria bacterium]|nr:LysM peptidoglycan-binding domain-containing protein [Ignavibacteria bacterium]
MKLTWFSQVTLSKIAKEFYGDAGKYMDIANANGIENPDKINVGQELKIP